MTAGSTEPRTKPRAKLAEHRPDERAPIKGVPPEILRQVKLIELRTRGLVNSLFTGEYRSVFKGQGMEFAEVREYQHGDEVRPLRRRRRGDAHDRRAELLGLAP